MMLYKLELIKVGNKKLMLWRKLCC